MNLVLNMKKGMLFGLAVSSILMSGCAGGGSDLPEESTEAKSTVPPFERPGTDVIEVTVDTNTTAPTAESSIDQPENTLPSETLPVQTQPSVPDDNTYTVVIDPGHGGTWVGALDGEYKEKNLALKTALNCRDYLLNNYSGVVVYLTRETDKEFSYDQKKDLEDRVRFAKEHNADIFVSMHFNSDPTNGSDGSLVCISKQPWVNSQSTALASSILSQLSSLGLRDNGLLLRDSEEYFDESGVSLDYYAICRHSASVGIPGIIVEHCFLRNQTDRAFYSSDDALYLLGRADAIGIANYLGLSPKG